MYRLDVKKAENKRQAPSAKRNSSLDIQRKDTPASRFLKAGQPNIFQTARCREKQGRPNRTGLPDTLKAGIEHLSGINMDDVRVHYNSSRPAQLQALAYTKGTDIHIAPGQTRHLPHEAWHVVQQKQGRVMPTMRLGGDLINDNPVLEREADCMGAKAVQGKFKAGAASVKQAVSTCVQRQMPRANQFNGYDNDMQIDIQTRRIANQCTLAMRTPLQAGNKIEALQKISKEAGRIGKIVRDSEMTNSEFFYVDISANYKTRKHIKTEINISRYESQIKKLDDNAGAESVKDDVRARLEKNKRDLEDKLKRIKPVTLTLKYQFRRKGVNLEEHEVGGPGYIVSVRKTRKGGEDITGEMINPDGAPPDGARIDHTYSNRHELTEGSILKHTYKRSNEQAQGADVKSKNFDAYTKLAGEGARFQCVRRNIATIADDTVIHVSGQNQGVKFCDLWKTWSASFDKKYNITDREIAEKLSGTTGGKPINTLVIKRVEYTKPVPVVPNNQIQLQ